MTSYKVVVNFNAVLKYSLQMQQLMQHIVVCLRFHVPKFIELKNWLPNSLDLNPIFLWIIHCGAGVATDGMVA